MNAFFFTISRNRNKPFTLHAKNSYHDFTQQKTVIPEFTQQKRKFPHFRRVSYES